MEVVWREGEANVREVLDALNGQGAKQRAYTTVMTIMRRLDAKGLLDRRRRGRADIYAPCLSREGYLRARAEARRCPHDPGAGGPKDPWRPSGA